MPSVIFAGTKVKALKKILNLNSGADIISSTNDPTSVATDGLPGSLLMNETLGFVYRKLDSGVTTNWKKLSSGGESGINYILNPDAEVNTTGWVTYADAAGSVPVNGTGGSPTVTWTRSTSSPLRGSASFLFTKDAANRQGEGASYDFTIDSADKNKNLNLSFDFAAASGTFVSGDSSDVRIFMYDVTNSVLIYPIAQTIQLQSGAFQTTFATTTSTSYRLIIHVATTSASAYTLKFDNVNVGPQNVVLGPAVNDWQQESGITFSAGFGTTTGVAVFSRRIGDSLEVVGQFTSGTTAASIAEIILPSGYTINSAKLPSGTSGVKLGEFFQQETGGANAPIFSGDYASVLFYDGSTTSRLYVALNVSTTELNKDNVSTLLGSNVEVSFNFKIPVQGWSAGVVSQNATTFQISNYLASGTRVTGAAPTQLGQYRSYLRNSSGNTLSDYTETNGAPTTAPTSADGILIYNGNAYASADTNNEPTRYDIFVGKNKIIEPQFYKTAGRNGIVDVTPFGVGTQSIGYSYNYDPTAGIFTIFAAYKAGGATTAHNSAWSGPNDSVDDIYFDLFISEKVIPVEVSAVGQNEVRLDSTTNTFGSTASNVKVFETVTTNLGSAFTYNSDAVNGDSVTINENMICGIYAAMRSDTSNDNMAITKNETTSIPSLTSANVLVAFTQQTATRTISSGASALLSRGDVIRFMTDRTGAQNGVCTLKLVKLNNL